MPLAATKKALYFPAGYTDKVRNIARDKLIGYWPLSDLAGSVAVDESGNGRNGAYTNAIPGAVGVDGRSAGSFDGTGDVVSVFSSALAGAFNASEGTLAGWAQVSGSGVWTDATNRYIGFLSVDGSNQIYIRKGTTNNQVAFVYLAGGTSKSFGATLSPTVYFHVAITWSVSVDQMKGYINGVQAGSTQTALGTWSGTLATATIGSSSTGGASSWSGNIQHPGLWTIPLSGEQIAALATVN